MSAPANVVATTLQSGGPGSYVITYSWTLGSSPSALSFSVTLYSIIWGVTAIVKGPINYTSSQLSDTYTNTVTGASYYCIVTAYAGAGQTGASAQFQSQQVSVYNPYGGPQGVQGYQGVQGLQGPTGPVGQQGLQGVQGLMQVTNYATTNQLVTTGGDSTHLTAYPLFTLNGTTLSLGAGANITTSGTSNSIGGVTLNNGAVSGVTTLNASGAIATSAGFTGPSINTDSTSSSRVSGVTLNNGAVSGVTTLNASGAIATSAGFTGPSFSATNFVTAGGGFTGPSSSTINGISIGLTNQNVSGVGTLSCGAITAPSINNGANTFNVTATTGTNVTTMTVGAGNGTGYSISAGTISCGAITSSGALGLSTNGITSGTHNPSATDTYNLGITGTRWKQVVASNFTGALTGNADTATNVAYSGLTGTVPTWNQNTTGNAATATTAGGLTGTPAITVGTITGSSLTLAGAISGVTTLGMGGALSGVTTISNTASAAITSIGESARPVTNIYATTFTGALTGNATGLSGTPNITVGTITGSSLTLAGAISGVTTLGMGGALSGVTTISNTASAAITSIGESARPVSNIYATQLNAGAAVLIGSNVTTGTSGGIRLTNAGGNNYIQSGANFSTSTAAPLIFTTMNAGAEWARFDSNGNVGIGTASPGSTYKLDVSGTVHSSYFVGGDQSANGTTNFYSTAPSAGGFFGPGADKAATTPGGGSLGVFSTTAFTQNTGGYITLGGRAHDYGSGELLQTFGRIMGYADTTSAYLGGLSFATQNGGVMYERFRLDADGRAFFPIYTAGTLSITGSGGQVSSSSDKRLKTNIEYVQDNATSAIMALKPARYMWLSDPSNVQMGFIAQDVETVIPEAVDGKKYEYEWKLDNNGKPVVDSQGNLVLTDKPRYRGFSDRPVLAMLVKAFQEMTETINTLSARLSNVEAQLART